MSTQESTSDSERRQNPSYCRAESTIRFSEGRGKGKEQAMRAECNMDTHDDQSSASIRSSFYVIVGILIANLSILELRLRSSKQLMGCNCLEASAAEHMFLCSVSAKHIRSCNAPRKNQHSKRAHKVSNSMTAATPFQVAQMAKHNHNDKSHVVHVPR